MKAIGFKYLLVVALSLLLGLFYVRNIAAKTNNNDLIILTNKVTISNEEKDWVANLPEVKFLTSQAPPMSVLDPKSQKQVGIAIEVLKFIANDLGLKYSVENNSDLGLSNNIKAVQDGIFDAFVPLSLNAEREKSGLFSQPFYSSVYAIIANENNNYFIKNLNDLKKYKVGFFKGFALEQQLK